MKTVTLEDFKKMLDEQDVNRNDLAFKCPMCGCTQSIRDFLRAEPLLSPAKAADYIGFSCVGRFTKAGPPRRELDGKPCNWGLGGLLKMHKLEVITEDGGKHPYFEPVSPEEAQSHKAANDAKDQADV